VKIALSINLARVAIGFVDLAGWTCVNVSGLFLEHRCTPGHYRYQRAVDLISGKASIGPFGSPVFDRAAKSGTPNERYPSRSKH
jgi:hypothetical protein